MNIPDSLKLNKKYSTNDLVNKIIQANNEMYAVVHEDGCDEDSSNNFIFFDQFSKVKKEIEKIIDNSSMNIYGFNIISKYDKNKSSNIKLVCYLDAPQRGDGYDGISVGGVDKNEYEEIVKMLNEKLKQIE